MTVGTYELSEIVSMTLWASGGVTFQDETDDNKDGFTLLDVEVEKVGLALARPALTTLLADLYRVSGLAQSQHLIKGSEIVAYLTGLGGWEIDSTEKSWICKKSGADKQVVFVPGDIFTPDTIMMGAALHLVAVYTGQELAQVIAGIIDATGKFLPKEITNETD